MMKEIKVTLSVLLSDRLDTIKRCLDSLVPLRESVNSELILTVTTEDPRVRRLAEEYGDRVLRFRWCNDFSKARNAGLEAALGNWFLYLDDDEWFEDCDELIRFFQKGECEKYAYADYIQRNYQDKGLHYYTDTPVSRMVNLRYGKKGRSEKNENTSGEDSGIRFKSRIHEYFDPVTGPGKLLGKTIALHTGYIQADEKTAQMRFRRNAPLLMQMMEEEPDHLRWPIQLVQEYRQVELWAWEAELGRKYLYDGEKPKQPGAVAEGRRRFVELDPDSFGAFCGAAAEGLTESGRNEEALSLIEQGLRDARCLDMTRAFLYLEKALILLRKGIRFSGSLDGQSDGGSAGSDSVEEKGADDLIRSEQFVEKYFQACRTLDKNPQKKARESGMVIVGEAAEKINRIKAESIRLCCRLRLGDYNYFEKALPILEWDQPSVYLLEELVAVWVNAMTGECETDGTYPDCGERTDGGEEVREDLWTKPLELAWKNSKIREKLLAEFHKRENTKLLTQIAKLKDTHWYVRYARVCVHPDKRDKAEIKKLLAEYFEKCENIFQIPNRIRGIMEDSGQTWEKLISGVDFVKLSRDMADYYDGQIDQGAVGSAEEYWFDPDRVLELWIKKGTDHINMLYNPAIVMENPSCLPQECQAVLCFDELLTEKKNETGHTDLLTKEGVNTHSIKKKISCLKKAIQLWSGLVSFARIYASKMQISESDQLDRSDNSVGESFAARSEMDQLAAQILAQVRQLIDLGEMDQAAAILSQLKTMVPENEEILRLEEVVGQ